MRILFLAGLASMALWGAGAARAAGSGHDFAFQSIDGGPLNLSDYRGQPVLVVNTASRCGFTRQYDGLQAVWERYQDAGLVVIGVPSGDFRQELASEAEVKEFCEVNFSIDFPMAAITKVKGPDAAPFFQWAGAPRWNFTKYLIGRDGALLHVWPSAVGPQSPEVRRAIDAALADGADG